jgi:hypothetical protein
MSKSHTGMKHSEEEKDKIGKGNLGKIISKKSKRRMSIAKKGNKYFLGKKHTDETKLKISLANKGENNYWFGKKGNKNPMYGKTGKKAPTWLGGKSFEPYTFEFNKKLKYRIRKRDKYLCQFPCCNKRIKSISVHHINYNKKNNYERNLICLCKKHHGQSNWNRDYWEIFYKEIIHKKYNVMNRLLVWINNILWSS